jgi:hypothetical protein
MAERALVTGMRLGLVVATVMIPERVWLRWLAACQYEHGRLSLALQTESTVSIMASVVSGSADE